MKSKNEEPNLFEESLKEERRKNGTEGMELFPETQEVLTKLVDMGIGDFKVLKKMMFFVDLCPDRSLFFLDSKKTDLEAVSDFINKADDCIKRIKRDYPAGSPVVRELEYLFVVMSVFLPVWKNDKNAARLMTEFVATTRDKVRNFNFQRWVGRLFGSNWADIARLLPDGGKELGEALLDGYPMGVLQSFKLDELDADRKKKFGLNDYAKVNNLHLLSAPNELGSSGKDLCEWELIACDHSEIYHADASANTKHHIPIYCGEKFVGVLKTLGTEWSFLVVRGVVQDGKPVLIKGGIYQFHGVRFEDGVRKIDLSEYQERVEILPLRMWVDRDELISKDPDTFRRRTLEEVVRNYSMLYGILE